MTIELFGGGVRSIDLDFTRPTDVNGFDIATNPIDTGIHFLDVYFLVDTTGSMRSALSTIGNQLLGTVSRIPRIFQILAEETPGMPVPDIAYGFGFYKDFTPETACFTNLLPLTRFTEDAFDSGIFTRAIAAIASSGTGGGDRPECQIFALNSIATNPVIGWRPETNQFIGLRQVTWVGDAPGHDPSGGVTTLEAIFNLTNTRVNVSGISVGGNGLNAPV